MAHAADMNLSGAHFQENKGIFISYMVVQLKKIDILWYFVH